MLYEYHSNIKLNTYYVFRSNEKSNIRKIIVTKDSLVRQILQKHGYTY